MLDATPSGPSANTYVIEADATTYLLSTRPNDIPEWVAANTAEREAKLVAATKLIDDSFDFHGRPTVWQQPLRWPRVGIRNRDRIYVDWLSIPEFLIRATANLAYELVKRDRISEPSVLGLGMDNIKVGPLSMNPDKKQRIPLLTDLTILELLPYGSVIGLAAGTSMTAKLVRG